MILSKIKPNWRHIHALKDKQFIHFNLQTLGLKYYIPYEFIRSYIICLSIIMFLIMTP